MSKSLLPGLMAIATLCALLTATSTVHARTAQDCHIGSYRLADGRLVDISAEDDHTLRWQQFDGETGVLRRTARGDWKSTLGWADRDDGKTVTFSACKAGRKIGRAHV